MFKRRQAAKEEHEEVEDRLSKQERELEDMARRVRALEIEVGIFKPELREANGS